ncbi:MAG: type II secretion system secretin GspD [Proteobacteria bacterium]|nr:type II secretion system secretin GspD [Pseudomonadota bacterium]
MKRNILTSVVVIASIVTSMVPNIYAQGAMVSMDFPDVEIKDMVKSISEITGKNFVIESSASGKISIMSPTPVSVDEAYQAFLSAISMKGFAVCEEGKVFKIMKKSAAKRECGIPVEEEFTIAQGDEMITRIIPIQYIDANEIQKALKLMISQTTGSSVAYGPTNSLIVTDSASNIRRLIKIIQKLDKQGFEKSVEVVPLQYAQATDIAEKILTIYSSGKKGSSDNSFSYNIERGAEVSTVIPDTRTNSLIVTANRKGLSNVLDLIAELDKQVANEMNQGHIHVRHLKHADAEEMADLLNQLLNGTTSSKKKNAKPAAKNISPLARQTPEAASTDTVTTSSAGSSPGTGSLFQDDVRIVADTNTNSLIVTATPGDFNSLQNVIQQLDVRRPQVFVEALIMEVNMTKGMEVGVSGHGGAANNNGLAFGGTKFEGSNTMSDPMGSVAGATGMVLGGFGKAMTLGGLSIPAQGFLFKAVQNNKAYNVLSAPTILTSDNKKAEIIVGSRVSVPTTSGQDAAGNPLRSFTTENVGLELHVTPQINDGDEVTLEIEQKIEDIVGTQKEIAEFGMRTDQRKAVTTVVAQNGQTVVIGGLIKDKESKTKSKVPVLGDIPIVGNLFKQTSVANEKVNLMVFLTPTILRDPKDMTRMSVQKNDQRRKFNKTNKVGEHKGLYNYGYDESMNMAAPASAIVEQQPVRQERPAKKRFNYEEQELRSAEAEAPAETIRARSTSTTPSSTRGTQPIRSRQSAESASSNPFADVKPQ